MHSSSRLLTSFVRLFVVIVAALHGGASKAECEEPSFFERDVRPILKAHCFHCHGEEGQLKGELDLRLRRWLVRGGESGEAIVPGRSDQSLLLHRVRDGEMPPGDKHLSAADLRTIETWIAQGARTARKEPMQLGAEPLITPEDRGYWSFQPVRRPSLPQTRQRSRVRTPIDAFIQSRLEQHGLSLTEDALKPILIRRVYLDLLGLPPMPEEVTAFVRDTRPDAYEQLLDRVLASPAYGERWGRHWLDVAGYADSEGYAEQDQPRASAFRYRDYVIAAFNRDLPYDQFVIQQLAGDELAGYPYPNGGDLRQRHQTWLTATGFLRMAPDGTGSAGVDQQVARNEMMADTLKIVSSSLLGLTVGCARCHNHRYDPISHADYHRFRAIFEPAIDWKNWKTPQSRRISLYTPAQRILAKKIEAEAAEVDAQRLKKTEFYIERTLTEELVELPEELRNGLRRAYRTPVVKRTESQKKLLKEHPRVANISAGSLYLYDRRREERARRLDQQRAARERELVAEVRAAQLAKVPPDSRDLVKALMVTPVAKLDPTGRDWADKYPGAWVTAANLTKFSPAASNELTQLKQAAARLRGEKASDDLKRYVKRAAEIRDRIPAEGFLRALTESGTAPPTFIFFRGDHQQPKDQIDAGELTVIANDLPKLPANDPALPTTGRRLAYARYLTNGRHPLLARVMVNRIWLHHFGRGLAETPDDFGRLGGLPTHPQLLDWLADEFVQGDWQIKRLHRLIMRSTVYRQSSHAGQRGRVIDPDNRLYGHRSLQRLDAESLRDAILVLTGQVNRAMYGPPIPVREDEVGQIVLGKEKLDGERKPTAVAPLGGEAVRRSIYVQVRRSRPLDVLETFDRPAMSPNCAQRNRSNVALQSLLLMNSDLIVSASRQFADRVIQQAKGDLSAQLSLAWRLAFAIEPKPVDLGAAESYFHSQVAALRQADPMAKPANIHRDAMATVCQAFLGSSRFLYVE